MVGFGVRPESRSLGTITTASPDTTSLDVSIYRNKGLQLSGTFGGATVTALGSLDGGNTFSPVATASAVGFLALPDVVLGKLKVSVSGGSSPSIGVAFAGLDARTY